MTPAVRILERFEAATPLGIRFQDAATGAWIGNGLYVTARALENSTQKILAAVNRTGVYFFTKLPGIRTVGDPRRRYLVQVSDIMGRYLPWQFTVDAPARGLYQADCAAGRSPLEPSVVPLFPGAATNTPAGFATVRAELQDAGSGRPAAWAVLEAYYRGECVARGVSDTRGITVLFPAYPEPENYVAGSQPSGPAQPLSAQSWRLDFEVFYEPEHPVPRAADLCRTLSQRRGEIRMDVAQADAAATARLIYGRELVLKTRGEGQKELPILLVAEAASPCH